MKKLQRLPATSEGRSDTSFVLRTESGKPAGHIDGPSITGASNQYKFVVQVDKHTIACFVRGSVDECQTRASAAYQDLLRVN